MAGGHPERSKNALPKLKVAQSRPVIEGQIRRYLTSKFSYAILYRVYSDRIVIAAIMSCRQNQNYWKERLES
jgi:hypothetical protein